MKWRQFLYGLNKCQYYLLNNFSFYWNIPVDLRGDRCSVSGWVPSRGCFTWVVAKCRENCRQRSLWRTYSQTLLYSLWSFIWENYMKVFLKRVIVERAVSKFSSQLDFEWLLEFINMSSDFNVKQLIHYIAYYKIVSSLISFHLCKPNGKCYLNECPANIFMIGYVLHLSCYP